MGLFFSILIDFAVFAFIINLLREMLKDIEDFEGDSREGMNTFPIFIGKKNAVKILFGLSFIPLVIILIYINQYLIELLFVTFYMLLFVCAPLLFFTVKIWNASSKQELHFLSLLLKWILFFGIFSIVVINYNIKYNA
jgi:4-hydroxybenzoate polyprenyltransferase